MSSLPFLVPHLVLLVTHLVTDGSGHHRHGPYFVTIRRHSPSTLGCPAVPAQPSGAKATSLPSATSVSTASSATGTAPCSTSARLLTASPPMIGTPRPPAPMMGATVAVPMV